MQNSRYYRALGCFWGALLLFWGFGPFSPSLAHANPEFVAVQSITPYLDRFQRNITEFRLDNGMKFIILENHDAPVVSFVTYANVGGANEPDGKTGVAHFLEHLAFKGTTTIGTIDYVAEKKALDHLDSIDRQLQAAKKAGKTAEVTRLNQEFQKAQANAEQFVKRNEYGQLVETQGGTGLNAATSTDATTYFYSFPSNKLELWMSLESERFLDPVFREFYKERDVILEERRMRTEDSPIGLLMEAFLDRAYTVHPYKRPVIGYDRDIRGLERPDVQAFFEKYYTPNNITIAIAGDVDPARVKQLASAYFGRFPSKPHPPEVTIVEPPQTETKEVTLKLVSQPWYLEGYHRPALDHPDNAVYEVIAALMSDGRTSRLYRALVEDSQLALAAEGFNGFPGDKYPNLLLFYAMTAPNASIDEVAKILDRELERLKNEPVSEEELTRVKNQLRASLIRGLDSNLGMARSLLEYDVKTGSWRNLFAELDAYAAVTPADIQRVARSTFTPENRTIGRIVPANSQ